MTAKQDRPAEVGTFCLVLHTHLPWLAHHGTWPVGEEWLHQAWATAYQPVFALLRALADEGRRDVLTLGVTPVLAAQLDDPYCLAEQGRWLGSWQARAQGMAGSREEWRREAGRREFVDATRAREDFEAHWRSGGSAPLRRLLDAGVIEVLGGPLTHSFTPLLPDSLARDTLRAGLADARLRTGSRPTGIWTPECAYAPGLEHVYAAAGIGHLVLDGPSILGASSGTVGRTGEASPLIGQHPYPQNGPRPTTPTTADAWRLADTDVVVVGRDLEVSYRVWSPKRGYPGDPWYRDFHTFDHEWGFRPARVTGRSVEPDSKRPYEPDRAQIAAQRDAQDFIRVVRERLIALREERGGRPGLVVAAYDTELFGHWWHEGPQWLGHVLRGLPDAGVRVTTLREATRDPAGSVHPGPSSWGSGKDWRVWQGPAVDDIVKRQHELTESTLAVLDLTHPRTHRSAEHDQLVRELLLALSSDWAFMVSKDSAAGYARDRFDGHAERVRRLSDSLSRPGVAGSSRSADLLSQLFALDDGPFGHLDARRFLS